MAKEKQWQKDQAVLPSVEFRGDSVFVRNIRDNDYRAANDFTSRYIDREIKISDVRSVDFAICPFKMPPGTAHTFVSFGLSDGSQLAISIEARKPLGMQYSFYLGLFGIYDLMYIMATERDLVGLRTNYRRERVYLYPIKTTPERSQRAFLSMLHRAEQLRLHPEKYNTVTNSCTMNLLRHVNEVVPGRLRWNIRFPLSFGVDRLLHRVGMLDTVLSLPEARKKYDVTDRARAGALDDSFSQRIRQQ